ncbi:MOSC domain-containing protein [Marinobacter mobilis]|uniref:MOSC domain-containing protein n=1 Tax=Marinobacter mobilis TaxID=488533 RepID=UPI0035C6A5F8
MQIQSLFIYPVKSLRGIAVDTMQLDDFGPRADRRWMLVDSVNGFVTQRTHPTLANIGLEMSASGELEIAVPGSAPEVLRPGTVEVRVRVWQDWVVALEAEQGASQRVSDYLGQEVRFVYMPETTFRRVDTKRVFEERRVGFADGFPFLIVSEASLNDLNARLEESVDIRRFRPNIVVSGAEPWQEDRWAELQVGGLLFRLVKPCSRCVMTTVNPDTGAKAGNLEPLRTLGHFRRTPDGVMFGMNAVHNGEPGQIAVGDPITII